MLTDVVNQGRHALIIFKGSWGGVTISLHFKIKQCYLKQLHLLQPLMRQYLFII